MATRIETDSMGRVEVPAEKYYGAQTARSLSYFRIGTERMPEDEFVLRMRQRFRAAVSWS